MNDVEKLDQPCSCTLVEVVVKVSHPFTLVSERRSDKCPLLVCKPIAHTASRDLSVFLPQWPTSPLPSSPRRICGHGQSLGTHGRPYVSILSLTQPGMGTGTLQWSRCTISSLHELMQTGTRCLVPYHNICHYASLLTPLLPLNISS